MSTWDYYLEWKRNPQGYTWLEYYNLIVTKKWVRQSKQRNYKRNSDIVYKDSNIKHNGIIVSFDAKMGEYDYFYIDNQYLKLEYSGASSDTRSPNVNTLYPFRYVTAYVDDAMYLEFELPNLILDTDFKIDNNGNLTVKYG